MNDGIPTHWDKWQRFFANMAHGVLPYLQLYVNRNQRGTGLGNCRGFRRSFQVPVHNNDHQVGQGHPGLKMVSPTQQAVEQAKALMKQEEAVAKEMAGPITKRKPSTSRVQTRGKRQGGKTTKKPASKKKAPPRRKPTKKSTTAPIPKDVFGNKNI